MKADIRNIVRDVSSSGSKNARAKAWIARLPAVVLVSMIATIILFAMLIVGVLGFSVLFATNVKWFAAMALIGALTGPIFFWFRLPR